MIFSFIPRWFSQDWASLCHPCLNQKWFWMEEEIIQQNKDNIKNIIASKFKEKLWCDKELEGKRKLSYYKEVINPNLEEHKCLSILTSVKKKMNIAIIRTNSHELHSETRHWSIVKMHGMKERVTFVTLRRSKMKNTFS